MMRLDDIWPAGQRGVDGGGRGSGCRIGADTAAYRATRGSWLRPFKSQRKQGRAAGYFELVPEAALYEERYRNSSYETPRK